MFYSQISEIKFSDVILVASEIPLPGYNMTEKFNGIAIEVINGYNKVMSNGFDMYNWASYLSLVRPLTPSLKGTSKLIDEMFYISFSVYGEKTEYSF